MKKSIFLIVSIFSIVVALPLFFDFCSEMQDGMRFFEIETLPLLILLMVIINFLISILYLVKSIIYNNYLLILQIIIATISLLVDYQIYFNSTTVCT